MGIGDHPVKAYCIYTPCAIKTCRRFVFCVALYVAKLWLCQCYLTTAQGRSQDFTLGATEAERRRRENRGAERGEDWGGDVPSPTDKGSGGASWAPAANAFLAYLRSTEQLVERTVSTKPVFHVKKSTQSTIRGVCPPLATPLRPLFGVCSDFAGSGPVFLLGKLLYQSSGGTFFYIPAGLWSKFCLQNSACLIRKSRTLWSKISFHAMWCSRDIIKPLSK